MSPAHLFSARVLGETQISRKRVGLTQTPKGLWGPYSLTPRGIDAAVSISAPGVYALGTMHDLHGPFEVCFVGRDDKDVKSGLRRHIADWYPQFFYQYCHSIKAAFEKECELYHDFNPRDNKAHPARNKDTDWTCPRCRLFD